jgi:hypothetical protein
VVEVNDVQRQVRPIGRQAEQCRAVGAAADGYSPPPRFDTCSSFLWSKE